MKIAIITSSNFSYASLLLQHNDSLNKHEFIVYLNKSKQRPFRSLIKKIYKIGILGAILGYYLRKCYQNEFDEISIVASQKNIKTYNFNDFKPANSDIHMAQCDLGISMGTGYIPRRFFEQFKFGVINIHHEKLPDYSGAASIIWNLYNSDRTTGYTIHQINTKIDKGAIIYKEEMPIIFQKSLCETISYNYRVLLIKSVIGLGIVLKDFEYFYQDKKENSSNKNYATPSLRQFIKIHRNHNWFMNEEDS